MRSIKYSPHRKIRIGLIFATSAILITSIFGAAFAASTSKTLSTNFTLVNLGTSEANVEVEYIKENGDPWPVASGNDAFTIPPDFGLIQIRQYFDETMSSGQGSAVVSSDQALGAVVQIQARNQTPTQGAYSCFSEVSSTYYAPLLARRHPTASGTANSILVIQNADPDTANVTVDFITDAGITYTKNITGLTSGTSYYYDLDGETNLPEPWIGSAVVTASDSKKIAVVGNFLTGPDTMQTYNAFAAENLGTNWVAPLFFVRLNNGLSTVVTVQNLSGGEIAAEGITMVCTKDADTFPSGPTTISVSNPAPIADNASYSFNPVVNTTMFPDNHWGGSCRIDSGSANTVVFVQMRYVYVSFTGAAAYEAIPEGDTNLRMVVPLIAKRLPNGFASVVTVQNMNFSGTATVNLRYMPSFVEAECPASICDVTGDGNVNENDAIDVGPIVIPSGGSIQRNHRIASGPGSETGLPDGWQGSLVVTSSGSPINGFVQLTNYLNDLGDTFMAHNAISLP